MSSERIAIINNGFDIARIIPFNEKDREFEFKIDLLGHPFTMTYFRLFSLRSMRYSYVGSEDCEITYHRAVDEKPAKIHIKRKHPSQNENPYIDIPITRFTDPSTKLFPIPLIEFRIPSEHLNKVYHENQNHTKILINGANVVTIFLARNDFNLSNLDEVPVIDRLLSNISIEQLASNSTIPSDSEIRLAEKPGIFEGFYSLSINSNIKLLIRTSFDFSIKHHGLVDIRIIENEYAEAILLFTRAIQGKKPKDLYCPNGLLFMPEFLFGPISWHELKQNDKTEKEEFGRESIASHILNSTEFSQCDKANFYNYCIAQKRRLLAAYIQYEIDILKRKDFIMESMKQMDDAIKRVKKSCKLNGKSEQDWLKQYPKKSYDNTLILANILCQINPAFNRLRWRYSLKGAGVHYWLVDEDFDIDFAIHPICSCDNLTMYSMKIYDATLHPLCIKKGSFSDYNVNQYFNGYSHVGLCFETIYYNQQDEEKAFSKNNSCLRKIYDAIVEELLIMTAG